MTFDELCEKVPLCEKLSWKLLTQLRGLLDERNEHLDAGHVVQASGISADLKTKLYVWLSLAGANRHEVDHVAEVI